MHIMNLTVTNINLYNTYVPAKRKAPSFKAHPDFYELKRCYNVTASSWFRRGVDYKTPFKQYMNVVTTLSSVFYSFPNEPLKMLIAGIGNSQEPFSHCATIKRLLNQRDVTDAVDLYIVDLQSKPSDEKLKTDSFYDEPDPPNSLVTQSFIEDTTDYGQKPGLKYRVKDDIYELVRSTYNNPQKSKWNTRIQEAIKTYDDESFRVISSNNTLPYIYDFDDILETVRQMCRCLKKGGYLILDPKVKYLSMANLYGKMEYFRDGIYRKL